MIHPGFLLIVIGVALLPAHPARVLAASAAIFAGLALAGLQAGPPDPVSAQPRGFLAVEGALLMVGALLALASAGWAARSDRSPAAVAGSAAAAIGGLGVALTAARYAGAAPLAALLGAMVTVACAGLLMLVVGRFIGRSAVPAGRGPAPPTGLAAVAVGALLAVASPATAGVFVGAAVAAFGGWMIARATDRRTLPVAPALALLLLPAWWLMATIAGPEGLATSSLPDLPWSPAAERLLAPVLLLSAWAMSGLWPLQRQEPAALTAPIAAVLLGRVAVPAVPDGLEHWRAIAVPVGLIALWHGVLTRDRGESVAALAWVGLVTVTAPGRVGAALLLLGGLALELADRLPSRRPRAASVLRPVAAVVLGAGALLAIDGGLRTEVVYTVIAVGALVAGAGGWPSAQASTASAPMATAPSA